MHNSVTCGYHEPPPQVVDLLHLYISPLFSTFFFTSPSP